MRCAADAFTKNIKCKYGKLRRSRCLYCGQDLSQAFVHVHEYATRRLHNQCMRWLWRYTYDRWLNRTRFDAPEMRCPNKCRWRIYLSVSKKGQSKVYHWMLREESPCEHIRTFIRHQIVSQQSVCGNTVTFSIKCVQAIAAQSAHVPLLGRHPRVPEWRTYIAHLRTLIGALLLLLPIYDLHWHAGTALRELCSARFEVIAWCTGASAGRLSGLLRLDPSIVHGSKQDDKDGHSAVSNGRRG